MKVFSSRSEIGALLLVSVYCRVSGGEPLRSADRQKDPARMNCGAQIECVTPDGHAGHVSRSAPHDAAAIALIMDDDTVTCLLEEGETDFVIELPENRVPDRFTFLNENAARGELKIAVSNQRLPASSPGWTEVEGVIPFAHKRLFGVSVLGVEAKFVKLSFHVDKQGRIAARLSNGSEPRSASFDQSTRSTQGPAIFDVPDFEAALSSGFAALHSTGNTLLLTTAPASVAPLPDRAHP